MKTISILLTLFYTALLTGDTLKLKIVAHRDFPVDHISPKRLKRLYLAQKYLIHNQEILPINYTTDNHLRDCFEKRILHKNRRALERYWLNAHFQGKRPPKVVKSTAALLKYLQKIPYAVGYVDQNTTLPETLKVLYSVECPVP